MKTYSRRFGLVIALSTVSIRSLAVRVDQKVADQDNCRKVCRDDAYLEATMNPRQSLRQRLDSVDNV
ncbi:MAG: hypothetical protein JWL86_2104 [Rhizobium sp.]|nr:hypothetical protein [Rhizobium sp.]